MQRLILSTGNQGKVKEMKELLQGMPFEVLSKADLGISEDPVEDGDTLEANAKIKADFLSQHCPEDIVVADDTGLFVAALDGIPGVHSARYASDGNHRKKLLKTLEGEKNRKAYFETVIVINFPNGSVEVAKGRCDGAILEQEQGTAGFGYDSVFEPENRGQSFAEMSSTEKNKISHRGRAMEALKNVLKEAIR